VIACKRPWVHGVEGGRSSESREVKAQNVGLRSHEQLETILHSWPNDEGGDEDDKVADHQMCFVKSEKQKDNRQNPEVVSGVGIGLMS